MIKYDPFWYVQCTYCCYIYVLIFHYFYYYICCFQLAMPMNMYHTITTKQSEATLCQRLRKCCSEKTALIDIDSSQVYILQLVCYLKIF